MHLVPEMVAAQPTKFFVHVKAVYVKLSKSFFVKSLEQVTCGMRTHRSSLLLAAPMHTMILHSVFSIRSE